MDRQEIFAEAARHAAEMIEEEEAALASLEKKADVIRARITQLKGMMALVVEPIGRSKGGRPPSMGAYAAIEEILLKGPLKIGALKKALQEVGIKCSRHAYFEAIKKGVTLGRFRVDGQGKAAIWSLITTQDDEFKKKGWIAEAPRIPEGARVITHTMGD